MNVNHLILFDATCPLCQRAVQRIQRWDRQGAFFYAPLESATADKIFQEHPELKQLDSLILLENFSMHQPRIWIGGRAVLRILWLLGGWRKCIGWMAYLPFGVDWIYRLVARHRHRFLLK
jgi:predicted DCC family thiol-disulfide oxidoreductase YuxK